MTHPSHTSRQHRGPGIRGRSFRGRSIRGLGIRGRGITLIEMMVALAITTFVVLVVNQLFNGVIQTVGRGTQAGEILQRSRAFDEQIATETELIISGGRDASNPYDWFGRMVGPAGREVGQPGGFLVVVQRVIQAPVTLEDQVQGINNRFVRSDQLMFIYDQTPLFDQTGKKRLPPLAPVNNGSFGGDLADSINAEYVRLWYGHVLQTDADGNWLPTWTLGNAAAANNPNAIAQDWVLGRQALFLRINDLTSIPPNVPAGIHSRTANSFGSVIGVPGFNFLYMGVTDVCAQTLNDLTSPSGIFSSLNNAAYKNKILGRDPAFAGGLIFANIPLITVPKPNNTAMEAADIARNHNYFMGGVSDFIVEFAGDLVTGNTTYAAPGPVYNPDGELDRDPEGRIKWYGYYYNADTAVGAPPNIDSPVSYPAPSNYLPFDNGAGLPFADAAFVWQHEPAGNIRSSDTDGDFRQWPWMLRIRYRLHDRRGQFEGREITVNPATGETVPEAGAWFETIIPVNSQGVK